MCYRCKCGALTDKLRCDSCGRVNAIAYYASKYPDYNADISEDYNDYVIEKPVDNHVDSTF